MRDCFRNHTWISVFELTFRLAEIEGFWSCEDFPSLLVVFYCYCFMSISSTSLTIATMFCFLLFLFFLCHFFFPWWILLVIHLTSFIQFRTFLCTAVYQRIFRYTVVSLCTSYLYHMSLYKCASRTPVRTCVYFWT